MVAAVTGFPARSRRRPHGGLAASRRYERRRPETTPLHMVVSENLESWLACARGRRAARAGIRRGRTPRLSRVRAPLLRLRPRGLQDVPHGVRRGLLLQGLRRLSVLQRPPHGPDGRATSVRYVLPRHKAATWVRLDELPAIDIHSLRAVPDARHQGPGRATRETVCAEARKTLLRGEGQAFRVPLIGCRKTRHQPHQPLIGSEMPVDMVAKIRLTGLAFGGVPGGEGKCGQMIRVEGPRSRGICVFRPVFLGLRRPAQSLVAAEVAYGVVRGNTFVANGSFRNRFGESVNRF